MSYSAQGLESVRHTPPGAPGVYGVIEYRDWCQEYRIRSEVDAGPTPPPIPSGRRESLTLTERAAMKLAESGRYMAAQHGGYKTFLTLTFDAVSRAAINRPHDIASCNGPWSVWPRPRALENQGPQGPSRDALPRTTIQRQVSRFFTGMRAMHARGWSTNGGRRVPGAPVEYVPASRLRAVGEHGYCSPWPRSKSDRAVPGRDRLPVPPRVPLRYCWVAENPMNADGERNPHVHVLLSWRVPPWLFEDWSARVEGLWRQGFAHLEKIREQKAATTYMLKAVGYLAKGAADGDQGPIRGNRYAISEGAHAPPWVTLERRELRAMGALVADVAAHCAEHYREADESRKALVRARKREQEGRAELRRQGRTASKARERLGERIRRRLEGARREYSERPILANKYRLVVRGPDAMREVRAWLGADHAWPGGVVPWLPEKPVGLFWDWTGAPPSADVHRMRRAIRRRRWAYARPGGGCDTWTDDEWRALSRCYAEEASAPPSTNPIDVIEVFDSMGPPYGEEASECQGTWERLTPESC